jgi:hypothetical protein
MNKALKLNPKLVVVGLYMGDDFENAFLITYGLESWARLRALPADKVNFDIWHTEASPSWHKKIRVWLSRHSVIYQLVFHGPLLGRLQGEAQIRNADLLSDDVVALSIPERGILEAFRPKGIARNLDQSNESIREGMRITFELLSEMNRVCRERGIDFLVVVIPTKEMVFAEYLEHNKSLRLSGTLDNLLRNERIARERTFAFLADAGVRYVDALPALRRSMGNELYARTAADMHTNGIGYRVIGEAVFSAMSAGPKAKR